MPLSTLHLTNAYHEQSGGIRTTYHALLAHAEQHERHMTLVVPAVADCVERRGRFTKIVHVRAPRSPLADRRYRILLPHRFLPAGHGPLWRILDDERPDVVEVCDKYSLCFFAGLIRRHRSGRGRPALVALSCERMDDNVEAYVRSGRAARAFSRAVLGRVYIGMFDLHLANSEYTADELRRAMRAPHLRPVHVCPPGVHLPSPIAPVDASAVRRALLERCGRPDAVVALYAGRLSPEKNVLALVGALSALSRRIPPVHLAIAGDGPLRSRLESDAAISVPGRVHFLGHVSRSALAQLLHACDVFIHPNPREPFGLGPLEAMAAGTPVVAPRLGGLRQYVTAHNAWVGPADPLGIAAALDACLNDPAGRARRVAAARRTAERHAWSGAAARMFAEYDRAHRMARPARRSGEDPEFTFPMTPGNGDVISDVYDPR